MKTRRYFTDQSLFRQLFSNVSHLFWAAALIDALYIFVYVMTLFYHPSEAMAQGMLLSAVPQMTEHILMSVLLLTAIGAMEEHLFRSA